MMDDLISRNALFNICPNCVRKIQRYCKGEKTDENACD